MKYPKLEYYIIYFTIAFVIASCSKIDDYKSQYMQGGSITYAGKMDSVNIFSGKYRVMLTGLFTSDPNIVKYRVFWTSRKDSLEVPVKRTGKVDTARMIIPNLIEGTQTFEIRTYDNQGNSSVAQFVSATVYGDVYRSSLVNRGVVDASIQTDSSALISWADVNSDAGVLQMQIQYATSDNIQHDTIIPSISTGQTTKLPKFKLGAAFNYKTTFKPTATAIDTFNIPFQSHSVRADVTSIYLSNAGPSFARNTFDGRWGTLAAPWVTNAAAKNKGGINGGYSSDGGGVINWETWGNTPVVNGIVYQPTAMALPAGSYTVSFDEYSEVQSNSTVYCIAAAGGNGIPILANLSSSLGYVALFNGAAVGTTSPNSTDTRSFTFKLTTPQVVSIGFLGNIVGNGNPGSYFTVKRIQLFSN